VLVRRAARRPVPRRLSVRGPAAALVELHPLPSDHLLPGISRRISHGRIISRLTVCATFC
jgi:hypothetical protein